MKIAVIGSGSWGTSLALVARRAGNDVKIYTRSKDTCEEINRFHQNKKSLPGISLDKEIIATDKLENILDNDVFLLVIPAKNIQEICIDLKSKKFANNKIIVICSKGIDQTSQKLLSEIVKEILPNNPIAVLSGPNFAHEVAENLYAITSIASDNNTCLNLLTQHLSSRNFRIYPNQDIIGTQVIAAAKNVLAIATGIVIGKNLGENAKSAVISRGIFEISKLLKAMGADPFTLFSPAGIGDINLTCNSTTSRNTSYGINLANNNTSSQNHLVEGLYSAKSIAMLAEKLKIDMPIFQAVYQITHCGKKLDEVVDQLINRPIYYL